MARQNRIAFSGRHRASARVTAVLAVLLAACVVLGGCDGGETQGTEAYHGAPSTEYKATSADLYCEEITLYSGPFVEDGSNEQVENVAAILVENRAEQFLDQATITYKVGDDTIATFVVTGLPSGSKAWVLEANRLTLDEQLDFIFLDCESAFRQDAVTSSELMKVSAQGSVLTAENTSDKTLLNACVYYKHVNSDGNFLGGITYMIAFDTLEAGESAVKASAHYTEDSRIVRYSYQTE